MSPPPRSLFLRQETTPDFEPLAQNREVVGGHAQPIDPFGLPGSGEIGRRATHGRHAFETGTVLSPVHECARRHVSGLPVRTHFPKVNKLPGLFVGQRFQQHTVDKTEDRRCCPNAEREREDGRGCETGVLAKLANGVTKVI